MNEPLKDLRHRIDEIDAGILDLLQRRNEAAAEVLAAKMEAGLPIFVPQREEAKVRSFRDSAALAGIDADWAEDFLRMIMSSSRARQSLAEFPRSTPQAKIVLMIGGQGRMGRLYGKMLQASGHEVRVLDCDDWPKVDELVKGINAVIVTVPIRKTSEIVTRIGTHLPPEALLCDFTSLKQQPLSDMMAAHAGPVLGLHPMHGADVENLTKQLMVACPGRDSERGAWLLEQFRLWGMRVKVMDPGRHDLTMDMVQGLRHFLALLHGSFLQATDMNPEEILALSSPVYRAELMMTGRIFAQNAELYADIVFASQERRDLLLKFIDHNMQLKQMVIADDKEGFIREFGAIREFFGDFATQALKESGYLIHRLVDRFS